MQILVTGGGGYIGSTLVPMLLEEGHTVTVVDRFFFGEDKLNIQSERLHLCKEDIRFVAPTVFEGIEAVIDLAALSNDPAGELDPTKTHSINHLGRLRIAHLAHTSGVKQYIFPSSCSIYGFQDHEVDETAPVNPLTTYAKANYNAENDILRLSSATFKVVVLRQSTVYGLSPRMRFDLAINGMTKGFFQNGKIPILRDGSQWRPMVHVRDTSRAMMMMLQADSAKVNGQIFNVGSNSQNYQIMDLARRVAEGAGIPFEYEWYGDPDHRSYRVNFDKIKRTIGFEPQHTAEQAAKEIWNALQEKRIDPDNPQTITLKWYKKLLAEGLEL